MRRLPSCFRPEPPGHEASAGAIDHVEDLQMKTNLICTNKKKSTMFYVRRSA